MAWGRRTSRFVKAPGTVRRSKFEDATEAFLKVQGVKYEYEGHRIPYTLQCYYTPDWKLLDNGIYVETKGEFDSSDRRKHKAIKEQHPELDIRFVFSDSSRKIGAKSLTTYAKWCEMNGFKYADKLIPIAWINEKKAK